MIGLLVTITLFPLVGAAVRRLIGNVQIFLAGAGVVGSLLFVSSFAGLPIGVSLSAIVLLSALVLWRTAPVPASTVRFDRLPTLILWTCAAWLLMHSAIVPLDDYDGRAFWLLKAKAIAHEGRVDGPFFQQKTSASPRNQYPLLVPMDAAVSMIVSRDLDERQTRWLYVSFAIGLALEIRRRLSTLFTPQIGAWLAAGVSSLPILLSPSVGALSAGSDIALGAFAACAFFEIVEAESPTRLGMWLSFMVLTKSEGLPFAALLLVIGAFTLGRRLWISAGLFGLATSSLFVWRMEIHPSDESPFARLILTLPDHLARFTVGLAAFARQTVAVTTWGGLWFLWLAAILVLVARARWKPLALALSAMIPMMVLYAAACAVTDAAHCMMDGFAPRALEHLLGPAFYVIGAALGFPSTERPASPRERRGVELR